MNQIKEFLIQQPYSQLHLLSLSLSSKVQNSYRNSVYVCVYVYICTVYVGLEDESHRAKTKFYSALFAWTPDAIFTLLSF